MFRNKSKIFLLCLIIFCMGFGVYYVQKPVVLHLGIFAGSPWDVPSPESEKIIDDAIERFEKKYPNVQVEYVSGIMKEDYSEWISQQALEGTLPDVYMVLNEDLSKFADVGMLQALDGYIAGDKKMDISKYFSSTYAVGTYGSMQYALPFESVPTMMFVNKTLLEKEGIEIPDSDWTWSDFYAICEKVTKDSDGDGKLDQFGQYGYTWQNALSSNSATLFNQDGSASTLKNSQVYSAIEFMRKLVKLNQNQEVTSQMFDEGNVAFCPMRFSEYRTYKPYPWSVKKYSSFEWDCITMPSGPQGDNASEMDTLAFGMSSYSLHKSLAWELLKMLSYDQSTQENIFAYRQGVSVIRDMTDSDIFQEYFLSDAPINQSHNFDFYEDMMENAILMRRFSGYDQAFTMADSEILRMIYTSGDIESDILSLSDDLDLYLESN